MTIDRADGQGDQIWFNCSLITFKASSAETDGAFLLFEMLSSRGKATPLHVHPNEDESFYVLEGELLAHADGEDVRVGPGGFLSIPRGTPHAFTVTSETARILTLLTPGPAAAEAFFRDGGEPALAPELPAVTEPDIPRIAAAAEKHGCVVLLGPPPFATAAAAG